MRLRLDFKVLLTNLDHSHLIHLNAVICYRKEQSHCAIFNSCKPGRWIDHLPQSSTGKAYC